MSELSDILKKIEADLIGFGTPPEEIRRLLALPRAELVKELRRRAKDAMQEADELQDYAEQRELGIERPTGPKAKA